MVLALYLGLGAIAGLLAGLFGIGGGLIIVPVLVFSFAYQGISPDVLTHMAVGTSLATIVFTSISSVKTHQDKGGVRWELFKPMALGIILGAVVGVYTAAELSGPVLQKIICIFALCLLSCTENSIARPFVSCFVCGFDNIVNEKRRRRQKALEQDQNREKVAIVLTDGNDTGSFVEPIDAAKVAKAKGVRVHVIAMGDPETIGETALDMDTIHRIAKESGGEAFEALNRDELSAAYDEIGKLEPQLYESTTYRPKQSLHHYLMALVVIMHLLAFSVATLKRRAATRSSLGESDV